MWLSDFSIANPVKVAVGVVLVGLFGVLALLRVPVQLTPEIVNPVVVVETRWPGASPQEVEKEIVSPQEEQLQNVEGMIDFRSESGDGYGFIEMEFAAGMNLDAARLEVANKLDQVPRYPEDAEEPVISTASADRSASAWFSLLPAPPSHEQLAALTAEHPELREPCRRLLEAPTIDTTAVYELARQHPLLEELLKADPDPLAMRTFAEDVIAARLERVAGVAASNVLGGSEQQVQIVVDPVRLAARQVTIAQLRAALAAENQDTSAGDLWEGKRRYVTRTLGRFQSLEQIERTIVAQRDGAPVYVRDLADVRLGSSKLQGVGRQRGVRQLSINVQRKDGANILEVMREVKAAVAELNAGVLKTNRLFLFQTYDETDYIRSALDLVRQNLYVGSLLTLVILLVFLQNGRSTLVVALSIPISVLGTFLVLRFLGRSVNVISLAGMAFAVGMVVDNAIVVLENIDSHYRRGAAPARAASSGAREVWGAILSSTLTTLAVFLPVIFIEQQAGQLFRDLAIAISAGIAISMLVALTVIPAASSRLLARRAAGSPSVSSTALAPLNRLAAAFSRIVAAVNHRLLRGDLPRGATLAVVAAGGLGLFGLMPSGYRSLPTWPWYVPELTTAAWLTLAALVAAFALLAWAWPRVGLALAAVLLSLGLSWMLLPPAEYLPEGNMNLVFGSLQPPPGYNVDRLVELGRQVEDRLRPYWTPPPGSAEEAQLDGPAIESLFLIARNNQMFLGARARDPERARDMVPLVQQATSGLPGVNNFVGQASLFERGLGGGRSIDVEISGPDLARLVELGRRVMQQLEAMYPPAATGSSLQARPSLDLQSPELHVRLDARKARDRDVTAADLGYAVNALLDGAYAGPYWHEGREIDLVIYGDDRFSQRTQDIANLAIATPRGELVRVGDVANVTLGAGPERVQRIDRQRAITIRFRPGPGISLEQAVARLDREIVQPIVASGELGGVYHFRLMGTADDLKQMRAAMSGSLLLAVFITYLLISGLYESFLYPVVIMVSVPLAAVGGVVALRLLNLFAAQRMDTVTMIGFVILIGTVVNNAILIVDQALVLIREQGADHRRAVVTSVQGRIRPIFMTTITTLIGLTPLVLVPGAGSELYRGLGTVMLGGLAVATLFTMFLVPMLFTLAYEGQELVAARLAAWPAPAALRRGARAVRRAASVLSVRGGPATAASPHVAPDDAPEPLETGPQANA